MDEYNKVMMVAVDTLRANHLGCYGHDQETSPFIDQLADEGTYFEKCYASDVPTPSSFTSFLCGSRGLENGIIGFNDEWSDFRPTSRPLPERFAGSGYRTGMISNLPYSTPWLIRGFHDIHPPGLAFQAGSATEVTEEARRWLRNHGNDNFFLFVHYWDPHVPYDLAPEGYKEMFSPGDYSESSPDMEVFEENEWLKAVYEGHHSKTGTPEKPEKVMSLYDSEIRYTDSEIENLFGALQELGIDEETLVVLFSDHGEAFGEYGFWDHHSCYNNISRVPLIFWSRDSNWEGPIEEYVQHLDVYPTVLKMAGLSRTGGTDGKNLLPLLEGSGNGREEVVVNTDSTVIQRMYVKNDYALVHTPLRPIRKHIDEFEFFDLEEDPDQLKDISEEKEGLVEKYRLELQDWLSDYLDGSLDLLHKSAVKGCSGLNWYQEALSENPDLAFDDKEFMREFINQYGEAAWLVGEERITSKEDMEAYGPRNE